jgi:hypothetical protein
MRGARVTIACASVLIAQMLACMPTPSGLSDDLLLLYGVGHRDGEASVEFHADGRVIAREQTHDAIVERRVQMGPAELEALRRTLVEHRCCRLRSRRKRGVPDEARPSLAIHWAGDDCEVTMWDGEWSGDPHAAACLHAVEGLHRRVMASAADDGER